MIKTLLRLLQTSSVMAPPVSILVILNLISFSVGFDQGCNTDNACSDSVTTNNQTSAPAGTSDSIDDDTESNEAQTKWMQHYTIFYWAWWYVIDYLYFALCLE